MVFLDDLKYDKLYKKKFLAPIRKEDKKHGSVIFLLSDNINDSLWLMSNPFMINKNRTYQSYYIEKDISYTINHENKRLEFSYVDNPLVLNESTAYHETTNIAMIEQDINDVSITEEYIQLGDTVLFFNELYDEKYLNETVKTYGYSSRYKQLLYDDRIRNNRDVLQLYKQIKAENPAITKTFIDLNRYKQLNLFDDLRYYLDVFNRNNRFNARKTIDIYMELLRRFIMDRRIDDAGYKKKTVFLNTHWNYNRAYHLTDYRYNVNPLSVLYQKLKYQAEKLSVFSGIDFIIFSDTGYFKFSPDHITAQTRFKFIHNINALLKNTIIEDDEPENSKNAIVANILGKIEDNKGIKINNLTGESDSEDDKERLKADLVKKVNDAAENAKDEEEAIENMEDDEDIKNIILNLESDPEDGVKLSASRIARIEKNNQNLLSKKVKGQSVKDLINDTNKPAELPETNLPIRTINDEWHHLKAINFEKEYNLDADIVRILYSLSTDKTYPVSILDIQTEDTSTAEDQIMTYTVKCEDYNGKRFTLKFDIPKLRDNRFMRLRGNEKVFSIELPLLPISKTDEDTVQIVSFYNKIFIRRYNTSLGKSTPSAGKFIKALDKYEGKDIIVEIGDNSLVCSKYELPIDYMDIASAISKITIKGKMAKDTLVIYFNQDEIRSLYKIDNNKGLPVAVKNNEVFYWQGKEECISYITALIDNNEFLELYINAKGSNKCTYSRASILNTDIPVIVILAHDLGLTKAMSLAGIEYDISEKRKTEKLTVYDTIKLSDAYIHYKPNYSSSLLMNGLKDCDLENMSVKDINSKMAWVGQLENFGGRIKSDGLDNFKDLMFDPITVDVCKDYKLPENYHEALIYSSNLLVDNKHIKHTDLSSNRIRTNEVIAAQFYRVLSDSYKDYALQTKHGRITTMSMKQSAVIDMILTQNTTSDLSIFQPLQEIETRNTISTKGVTGMNSERAYKIDKRGYDDSMVNVIAQSTGFASTVGVNRQITINPNIVGGRGYIKQSGIENMNIANTYGMTEALSPFMITSDDPFRNDMTFVQTSKHGTPTEFSMPSLVTSGADAAMPYLCSNMFAKKAVASGKVKEITDEYMIVQYKDGREDYVRLDEQTMKNSDGGFYITLQLKTDLKVGQTFKEGSILAYDKKSFSDQVGGQLAYHKGILTWCAIMSTEDGYEDAGVIGDLLANAMASDIVVCKDISLPAATNVLLLAKKGTKVHEGDPIMIFQNAFNEEDANVLLKNLNNEDGDVSEIGKHVIRSKVTGELCDIKIYRTCEIEEMSESLQKIVKSYEANVNKHKRLAKNSASFVQFDSTDKLPQNGKLKHVDGVYIELYMKYHDKMGVGDKLANNNANKNVVYDVYSYSDAPYTDRMKKDGETIQSITSCSSVDGRMVLSSSKEGTLNKIIIMLTRQVQEKLGIKYRTLDKIYIDELKKSGYGFKIE